MSTTYFAVDGSYGDGDGIVIINTTNWTDEDWDRIDEEIDYYRPELALQIEEEKKNV